MSPVDFLTQLKQEFRVKHTRGDLTPIPGDIDLSFSGESMSDLIAWMNTLPNVFLRHTNNGKLFVYLFFENRTYLFDIEYSLDHISAGYPFLFSELVKHHPQLLKDETALQTMRYFLTQRSGTKHISFTELNWESAVSYLPSDVFYVQRLSKKWMLRYQTGSVLALVYLLQPRAFLFFLFYKFNCKIDAIRNSRLIAILGPDGVGKSTVIEKMCEAKLVVGTVYMGDKQYRLQRFYEFLYKCGKPFTYFQYPFQFFENWIRIYTAMKLRLRGGVVLADRYPTMNYYREKDVQSRYGRRMLYILFPEPHRYILLTADPDDIVQRKAGLTVAEARSVACKLERLLEGKQAIQIKNDELDTTLPQVASALYNT